MKTRKILDITYRAHITVTLISDPKTRTPYRVHLIEWDPAKLTHRRKQIAKYSDFPSCLWFVSDYLTR